ncbi:MAG: Holliday junction branch migration protein RuvA [Clostridiales Family XIII bacterium]|jgi:Holliday junction DNA helicase RuvA|nr:Holliday junction branch migration protein RuvA [Clostridiales Family XIII bacterium]
MICHLRGRVAAKLDGKIVIEAGGIGYEVYVPGNSPLYGVEEGGEALVHTAMLVKEDGVSLCGFSDRESLALFRMLTGISGVGAKAALSLLSALRPPELSKAIAFGDTAMLTRANGIGKKSAERIILELKDKSELLAGAGQAEAGLAAAQASDGAAGEAVDALVGLGYSRAEAVSAVAAAKGDGLTAEEYIRQALRRA